jgi:pimeloyl-ACP methyl ester carboxylesterase
VLHSVDAADDIPPPAPPPRNAPLPDQGGRPSLCLFLTEPARGAADSLTIAPMWPLLVRAPRGHGRPVLVLPGLLGTDSSTLPLRTYLTYLGYAVHGWALGRNHGPTAEVMEGMPSAVWRLYRHYQQPVALVGWSLGGIYARHLARITPDLVRQVITLGSPFAMSNPHQTRAMRAYSLRANRHVVDDERAGRPEPDRTPLPVPSTSVYSRKDGIVAWQTCREDPGPHSENVAVRCSHLGFGHRASVLWLVADRLAQEPDQWRPFTPPRMLRPMYPADVTGTVAVS